ncbi:hypothetical protein GWI33_019418 [Rhynchophorus ferrugineus]|uniref:Uncharacterized protein n=1 Tax=Rhynchophorus ferrugineus TaxID=354439 RepID=A0A834M5B8_RHYFE|nr:hypothetical protein GWI33_019418 [Rhynchophorus ferrugineus]
MINSRPLEDHYLIENNPQKVPFTTGPIKNKRRKESLFIYIEFVPQIGTGTQRTPSENFLNISSGLTPPGAENASGI